MHSADMTISNDIKRVREERKESQEAFAGHFGVDQTTIHRWETGGVPSRGPAAALIERVLADLGHTKVGPTEAA